MTGIFRSYPLIRTYFPSTIRMPQNLTQYLLVISAQCGRFSKAFRQRLYAVDGSISYVCPKLRNDTPDKCVKRSDADESRFPRLIWNHFLHDLQRYLIFPLRTPLRITESSLQCGQESFFS